MTWNLKNSIYPQSFLCEEAKDKQHTFLKKELCEISEEAIWKSRFSSFFWCFVSDCLWIIDIWPSLIWSHFSMDFLVSRSSKSKVTGVSLSVGPEITRLQLSYPLVSLLNKIMVIFWSFADVIGSIRSEALVKKVSYSFYYRHALRG